MDLKHITPRTRHYARDTPIFATGKNPIIFVKKGVIDEKESEMMMVRWKIFHFHAQIPEGEQREISPCAKCFPSLILENEDI